MSLFEPNNDKAYNWLPQDGTVHYYGKIISLPEADAYYQKLMSGIAWQHDEAAIFGKRIVTKRKVAWYGDKQYSYTYSNVTKTAFPWTPELLELKSLAEKESGESYNSCLLNLYHNGNEGMAWHSDGERDLKKHGAIASISLGAERKFAFKHKETGQKVELLLEHGSLLVMKGLTQEYWQHHLPPTKKINSPRINLTFRSIVR